MPNDRSFYQKSPVARFTKENGDLSAERLKPSKLINRKLKMHDSFTRVLPAYSHEQRSGYTSSLTHKLYPEFKQSVDKTPMHEINRAFTKK